MTRILVTGARGFIGSHLVEALPRLGKYQVYPSTVDVTDFYAVYREFTAVKPAVAVHAAAIVSTVWAAQYDWYSFDVNVKGAYNVARAAEAAGCELIYLSSTSVYRPTKEVITEDSEVRPTTLYNFTKWLGELAVGHVLGDGAVVLRLSHVYGPPPQDHSSLIANLIEAALCSRPAVMTSAPWSLKSYLYIDDCVEALRLVIDDPAQFHGVYNVAGDERRTLRDVVSRVSAALAARGFRPVVVWRPELDYMGDHVVSSEKFRRATGWRPRVSLEEGVERAINKALEHYKAWGTGFGPEGGGLD